MSKMRISEHPRNYNGNRIPRFSTGHRFTREEETAKNKKEWRRPAIGVYRSSLDKKRLAGELKEEVSEDPKKNTECSEENSAEEV